MIRPSSMAVDGVSAFDLIEAEGAQQWDAVGVHKFRYGRKVASGGSSVNDFNWKTPKVKLLESAFADEDAELEIYDYPVGYRRPDQGARLAQHRLESLRVPAKYCQGEGNVTTFAPARTFAWGPLAHAAFAGEYLLETVEHIYFNRKFQEDTQKDIEEGINYRNQFHAIPKDVRYRPELVTPHPHIAGCHTAMVRGPEGEEIHTDAHGRFRAQFHWDREAVGTDADSRWLRNVQETQTGMVLARMEWEQSVAYINGDPDRPLGFARQINGTMQPEYQQPGNMTRMTMKTPSYPNKGGFNEIRIEDIAGQQHFDWNAQKDMINEIVNDRSEHVGADESHIIGNTFSRTVENDQSRKIGGNHKVTVGNGWNFSVENDRTKKVTGNEEYKVSEVFSVAVSNNDNEEITGNRKTETGENDRGSISRAVKTQMDRSVTGTWTAEGQGNFDMRASKNFNETVKSTKTTSVSDGNISIKVGDQAQLQDRLDGHAHLRRGHGLHRQEHRDRHRRLGHDAVG